MKFLIKIYLDNINPYDIMQILDVINSNIINRNDTKIQLMTNDSSFDFKPYDYCYLKENTVPKMINHNLSENEWDIILPIIHASIINNGFDQKIINIYNSKFSDLNGVIWLNDNTQKTINTFPIIGRKYYENIGHIYNPVYYKKNYEEEFTEVMKMKNNYHYVDNTLIKMLTLKNDDDNIYELRKKFNFGL